MIPYNLESDIPLAFYISIVVKYVLLAYGFYWQLSLFMQQITTNSCDD